MIHELTDEQLIEQMNIYYDKRAYLHDDFMSFTSHDNSMKLFQPILSDLNRYVQNKSVLEFACGTGNWTGILAQKAKQVVATDTSSSMLSLACSKLSEIKNVSFETQNIYELPVPAITYDTIFSADLISHIPYSLVGPVLFKMFKFLKVGGVLIFIDMLPVEMDEVVGWYTDSNGNNIGIRELPNGEKYHVIKNYPSPNYFDTLFKDTKIEFAFKTYQYLKRWMLLIKM